MCIPVCVCVCVTFGIMCIPVCKRTCLGNNVLATRATGDAPFELQIEQGAFTNIYSRYKEFMQGKGASEAHVGASLGWVMVKMVLVALVK